MKVWVVMSYGYDYTNNLIGIFSTEEKAQEVAEKEGPHLQWNGTGVGAYIVDEGWEE